MINTSPACLFALPESLLMVDFLPTLALIASPTARLLFPIPGGPDTSTAIPGIIAPELVRDFPRGFADRVSAAPSEWVDMRVSSVLDRVEKRALAVGASRAVADEEMMPSSAP